MEVRRLEKSRILHFLAEFSHFLSKSAFFLHFFAILTVSEPLLGLLAPQGPGQRGPRGVREPILEHLGALEVPSLFPAPGAAGHLVRTLG